MSYMISNRLFYLLIVLSSCTLFLSDQIVKMRVLNYLTDMQSEIFMPLGPFIDIILVWNKGISFGFLSGKVSDKILLAFTGSILLIISYFYWKHSIVEGNRKILISFAFILGGACGNMADRIYYGAVLDYIDFYYGKYHFPTFNLADVYIFLGAILFLILHKSKKDLSKHLRMKGDGRLK